MGSAQELRCVGKIANVIRSMSIPNTLVPWDSRGKKLPVKLSICRGYIVAAVYLDKRRGAPNALSRGKEARMRLRYGRMSLLIVIPFFATDEIANVIAK